MLPFFQRGFSVFQLLLGLCQGLFGFLNCLLTILQLLPGIRQLLQGICLFPLIIRFSLPVFLLTVQKSLLRLLLGRLQALLRKGCQQRLDYIGGIGQGIVIYLRIGGIVPLDGGMNLRIISNIKGFFRNKEIIGDSAAANGGIAPVGVHIQRRTHEANDGEFSLGQLVKGGIGIIIRHGNRFADDLFSVVEAVCQAFVRCLRHSALQQHQAVDFLRDGIEAVDRRFIPTLTLSNQVGIENALGLFDARQPGNRLQLGFVPAIGGKQPQVKHILGVHIFPPRFHHIRFGGAQTHKHTGAQGNNHGNGDITPEGFGDGAPQIPAHHISFHYHSISEISMGCSFFSMPQTVPFFT